MKGLIMHNRFPIKNCDWFLARFICGVTLLNYHERIALLTSHRPVITYLQIIMTKLHCLQLGVACMYESMWRIAWLHQMISNTTFLWSHGNCQQVTSFLKYTWFCAAKQHFCSFQFAWFAEFFWSVCSRLKNTASANFACCLNQKKWVVLNLDCWYHKL